MRKLALGVAILATAALTACGAAGVAPLVASAESEALAVMGVDQADLAAAETTEGVAASPDPGDGRKLWTHRRAAKVLLARNVLHGEAVVETKEGPVTVVVQRGEVTEINGDSVTVKSSDGFALTWTYHDELRVIEKRTSIQPSEIQAGAKIALAGPKSGDGQLARLIVVVTG